MDDLKRCPFCGNLPRCGVDFYEMYDAEIKLKAVVECTGCKISKHKIFKATENYGLVPFIDYQKAFDAVVEEWNRRVNE